MIIVPITKLENTGIVRTVATGKLAGHDCNWKDTEEGAMENRKELCDAFGIELKDMIFAHNVHSNRVYAARRSEGEVIIEGELEPGFDGLVTNEKGLLLCTLEADCVPVYILDPVKKVIGMVHSGWRGTASLISVNAVRLMHDRYDSNYKDIMVAIGPCICKDCYEVGEDLREEFSKTYDEATLTKIFREEVKNGKRVAGKYLLDLPLAIRTTLIKEGLNDKKIFDPEYCTFHETKFSSYRREKENAGRMLTGIIL